MTDPLGAITAHLADTHLAKYKNNQSLESAQSKRRKEALERTKKQRELQIERTRKLFEDSDEEFSDGEGDNGNTTITNKQNSVFGKIESNTVEADSEFLNFRQNRNGEDGDFNNNYPHHHRSPKPINKKYQNKIMTNEWLLETPEDLPDWIWIPCPMGRRSLVVASNGETRAYHSKGFQRAKFQSILPNGNYLFNYDQENRKESNKQTILDCVLNFESKTCYVLDLIKWKGYNYYEGSAGFRHSWKQTLIDDLIDTDYKHLDKAVEQRDSMEIDRENNHYNHEKTFSSNQITAYKKFWKIVPLKAFKCDELNESNKIDDQDDTENMSEIQKMAHALKQENNDNIRRQETSAEYYHKNPWKLDGILVYHKEGIYYPAGDAGETYPLFGWLKQDRMKELLNSYAEFIDDTPLEVRQKMERRFKNSNYSYKNNNNNNRLNKNATNQDFQKTNEYQIPQNSSERFAASIRNENEGGFKVPETPVYLKNYENKQAW